MNPMQQIAPDEIARVQAASRQQLHDCWERIAEAEKYPLSKSELVRLLRGSEYELDENVVDEFLRQAYIPFPAKVGGEFQWEPYDVILMLIALEQRRLWKIGSRLHHYKMAPAEIERNILLAAGREKELLEALRALSVEDLIEQMVQTNHEWARRALAIALSMKLRNARHFTDAD